MSIDPEGDERKAELKAALLCAYDGSCAAFNPGQTLLTTTVNGHTRSFTVICTVCGRSATDAGGKLNILAPSAGSAASAS